MKSEAGSSSREIKKTMDRTGRDYELVCIALRSILPSKKKKKLEWARLGVPDERKLEASW